MGVRTVAIPHLQSTVSLWTLRLGSELVYNGDIGATEPGPASERHGVEFANYYSPYKWLTFDGDLSLSRARFTEIDEAGQFVPEAVGTVVSAGASVDGFHRAFGSLRWRYFGPRPLVQDDSVRSKATSLVNLQGGHLKNLRVRATESRSHGGMPADGEDGATWLNAVDPERVQRATASRCDARGHASRPGRQAGRRLSHVPLWLGVSVAVPVFVVPCSAGLQACRVWRT